MFTWRRFLPSRRCRSGAAYDDVRRPGPGRRSAAGVQRRRLRRVHAGRAEGPLEGVCPAAVLERRFELLVDPLAHLRAVLGVADADPLLRERLSDDLQLALVLGREAGEDRAVRGHALDGTVEHLLDALGVAVEAD